ncbi:MAG: ParB/RepB/Spo0J family partition protein [Candidatus Ancillula trichonymphae]|jgi:ParB family chromosome partitioning protein|nr:ParB/RepB/Spo0J family partition protein [Candidatus Ancillula trichonymphae]
MAKRRSLGTGLGALIPGADSVNVKPIEMQNSSARSGAYADKKVPKLGQANVREPLKKIDGVSFDNIPLSSIEVNKSNPRKNFDDELLAELAASIQEFDVIQPIRVRQLEAGTNPKYELVAGERRYRASIVAQKKTIPAIIAEVQDDALLSEALIENLHRVDLNPLEEAAAYQQLLDDFSITQEELSKKIARSRPRITNTLRLMRLPAKIQRQVATNVITAGHARALLGLKNTQQMEELAARIVAHGLSVRKTEEEVALLESFGTQEKDAKTTIKKVVNTTSNHNIEELQTIANDIAQYLDTVVNVKLSKRRGQVVIDFADLADLRRLNNAITGSS